MKKINLHRLMDISSLLISDAANSEADVSHVSDNIANSLSDMKGRVFDDINKIPGNLLSNEIYTLAIVFNAPEELRHSLAIDNDIKTFIINSESQEEFYILLNNSLKCDCQIIYYVQST